MIFFGSDVALEKPWRRMPWVAWALWLAFSTHAWAAPISFEFAVKDVKKSPFLREVSAELVSPSGRVRTLPAFFAGDGKFAVRARAEELGTYRLGKITEREGGRIVVLPGPRRSLTRKVVRKIDPRLAVGISPSNSKRFMLSNGEPFTPIGANLPWPDRRRTNYFQETFSAFADERLNWTRVWMAHWSGLNLEWPAEYMQTPPQIGQFNLAVARNWDDVIDRAEANGVYFQLVLQHHGQYTTGANSNWKDHPWNAANPGGFLLCTSDFFTSPVARALTAVKYRYIIARWGYSPSIMAWELFNEVHWTNALHDEDNEEAVADWHSEMAAYIRSIDVYRHLITTSLEDLRSPVYRSMDYLQPHMYAPDMLSAVRDFDEMLLGESRPVFYGEIGDDHMVFPDDVKKSGLLAVPPVWAGLMGAGTLPPQPWTGGQIMDTKRLGELGAVARFLSATKLAERQSLTRVSARTESVAHVPLMLLPGQFWRRSISPVITIWTDGREPTATAQMPRILVGSPDSLNDGFPGQARIKIALSQETDARLRITNAGAKGAVLRVAVNGISVIEHTWASLQPETAETAPVARPEPRPEEFILPLAAGENEILLENVGGQDWVEFESLDFRLDTSAIGAVGKRDDLFLAFWLWRRDAVFSPAPAQAVGGLLFLDDVAKGQWRVSWWDTLSGQVNSSMVLKHEGGEMRLEIPAFSRHAAVVVERVFD